MFGDDYFPLVTQRVHVLTVLVALLAIKRSVLAYKIIRQDAVFFL